MNKRGPGILLTLLLSLFMLPSFGFQVEQENNEGQDTTATPVVPTDWYLKDPETDSVQGVSADRAYSTLLKGKPSRTVVVAVIDSGVDIEHEDLKDNLW